MPKTDATPSREDREQRGRKRESRAACISGKEIESNVAVLKTDAIAANARIAKLQEEATTSAGRIKELEEADKAAAGRIKELEEADKAAAGRIKELEEAATTAAGRIKELQVAKADAAKRRDIDVEQIETLKARLCVDSEQLDMPNKQLLAVVEKFETDLKRLQDIHHDLTNRIAKSASDGDVRANVSAKRVHSLELSIFGLSYELDQAKNNATFVQETIAENQKESSVIEVMKTRVSLEEIQQLRAEINMLKKRTTASVRTHKHTHTHTLHTLHCRF